MSLETVQLTPAQMGFLKETIPAFEALSCSVTSAGRAGSDRRFFRVHLPATKESFVLVAWNSEDHDWNRFISIQRDLAVRVPFLPRIFAYDDGHGLILEEDLGAVTLKKFCVRAQAAEVAAQYRRVLDALALWQQVDPLACATIASRDMDLDMFLWESEYFTTHCVKEYFGLDKLLPAAWEQERMRIAAQAAAFFKVCIHRDFQSENILLRGGSVRFVDFQGARRGPAGYDVGSLLYDPYASKLTPSLSKRLFEYYLSRVPFEVTPQSFRICSIQRLMQALGAYANLSIHKGKDWYRSYIPVALKRLEEVIGQGGDVPALAGIVAGCIRQDGIKKSPLSCRGTRRKRD